MTTVESGTAVGIEYVPRRRAPSRSTRRATQPPATSTWRTCSRRGSRSGCAALARPSTRPPRRTSAFGAGATRRSASSIWILGAMAAEHVFYKENSTGVGGDVAERDGARPRYMVGACARWALSRSSSRAAALGVRARSERRISKQFEAIGTQIMNRDGTRRRMMARPDRSDPGRLREAQAAAQHARSGVRHGVQRWSTTTSAQVEQHRRGADRAQGDPRRRGARAARGGSSSRSERSICWRRSSWPML